MHVDDAAVVKVLNRLVARLTPDSAFQQDLLQEALIHLWLIETRRPGQTTSWYLQSCRFHLQHYINSGRSVDSAKRRAGQVALENSCETDEFLEIQMPGSEDFVLSEVIARDLVNALSQQLSDEEKAVLDCLTEGLGSREIGRKLQITHTKASRHRSRIAKLLTRLEKQSSAPDLSPAFSMQSPNHVDAHLLRSPVFGENVMPVLRAA